MPLGLIKHSRVARRAFRGGGDRAAAPSVLTDLWVGFSQRAGPFPFLGGCLVKSSRSGCQLHLRQPKRAGGGCANTFSRLRGCGADDQGPPARCPCPRPGRRLPSRGQLPHVQRIHVSSRFSWFGCCGAGASPPGLPHPLTLCRSQRILWEVPPSRGAVGTQQEGAQHPARLRTCLGVETQPSAGKTFAFGQTVDVLLHGEAGVQTAAVPGRDPAGKHRLGYLRAKSACP